METPCSRPPRAVQPAPRAPCNPPPSARRATRPPRAVQPAPSAPCSPPPARRATRPPRAVQPAPRALCNHAAGGRPHGLIHVVI
jgi:hypothetical protein